MRNDTVVGLPASLYYSLSEQQPKRLLWPLTYHLDMCGMTCDEGDSRIFTQVSLRHGLPGETLTTASPSFCRHDPRSLYEQRKLCGKYIRFSISPVAFSLIKILAVAKSRWFGSS